MQWLEGVRNSKKLKALLSIDTGTASKHLEMVYKFLSHNSRLTEQAKNISLMRVEKQGL